MSKLNWRTLVLLLRVQCSSDSIPVKWGVGVGSGSMNDKLCSHCGSRRSDLLQCSGCGLVHYCAPTCQKSDWKKHKRSCKPFKLETVAGKGLGLVATRPISQGDLLIREKATLMLPLNSSDKVMWERIKRNIRIENNECCVGGTYLLDISVLLYSINLKLKSSISSIFHERVHNICWSFRKKETSLYVMFMN